MGRDGHRGCESPDPITALGRRPRPLPERILQAVGRRVGGSIGGNLGRASQRGRYRSFHPRRADASRRSGPVARRRSDADVPPRARTRHARRTDAVASGRRAARHGERRRAGRAARRQTRARTAASTCWAATRSRTRRRSSDVRTFAAHEGERPVPERRPRSDGERPSGRLPAEWRHAGAGGERGWRGRVPSGRLRARRASSARCARRCRHAGARGATERTRRQRDVERSSTSPSSPGSTVTGSSSSGLPRRSRESDRSRLRGSTGRAAHPGR